MPLNQKFEVMLLARKTVADPSAYARRLLEDLKGCTVLEAIPCNDPDQRQLLITMQINGIDKEHTTDELGGLASALRIVCDRAAVNMKVIRRIKTNGLLDEVNRHLGR